jgi:hypothetical protein
VKTISPSQKSPIKYVKETGNVLYFGICIGRIEPIKSFTASKYKATANNGSVKGFATEHGAVKWIVKEW